MRTSLRLFATMALVLGLSACDSAAPAPAAHSTNTGSNPGTSTGAGTSTSVTTTTTAGVTPRFVSGNIAGDAFTVCKLELVVGVGNGWWGRKVERPQRGTLWIDAFNITISPDGRSLSFQAMDPDAVQMRHVVVKGGPDTYIYDYDGTTQSDGGLVSPANRGGSVPEISHYTICYNLL